MKLTDKGGKCQLCEGLTDKIAGLIYRHLSLIEAFEFSSVSLGIILPAHIINREDELRASLKLKEPPTIKRYLANVAIAELRSMLGRPVMLSHINADVSLTLDFITETVDIRASPIYLLGRYIKQKRGIPLRTRERVNTQSPSLEALLERALVLHFGAEEAKFSWAGGEDKDSLVLGQGRPFVAKLTNPRRRTLPPTLINSINDELGALGVGVTQLEVLTSRPKLPFHYIFTAEIACRLINSSAGALTRFTGLSAFSSIDVLFERPGRPPKTRRLLSLGGFRLSDSELRMTGTFEGGFDIRAFFGREKESRAQPNAHQLLRTSLELIHYDILEVKLLESALSLNSPFGVGLRAQE